MEMSLLFVCLGNICRSPLAKAAFRRRAGEARLVCRIDSAGTGNWHSGDPPDPRAVAEAMQHSIDISHYKARQITRADFSAFSHILALDLENLRNLKAIAPTSATARLSLLLDHVPGYEGRPVADPYCGDAADFARTWSEVDLAAQHLVADLKAAQS
jgi:protein-tyrosine phosphatase